MVVLRYRHDQNPQVGNTAPALNAGSPPRPLTVNAPFGTPQYNQIPSSGKAPPSGSSPRGCKGPTRSIPRTETLVKKPSGSPSKQPTAAVDVVWTRSMFPPTKQTCPHTRRPAYNSHQVDPRTGRDFHPGLYFLAASQRQVTSDYHHATTGTDPAPDPAHRPHVGKPYYLKEARRKGWGGD